MQLDIVETKNHRLPDFQHVVLRPPGTRTIRGLFLCADSFGYNLANRLAVAVACPAIFYLKEGFRLPFPFCLQ
ncbi:hypothetical protein FF011L_23690 [Roseimaritima multifibrata]|uniref:Uncharacterized protein n=1 Tax=Roseimaritima multifibrata TaxID=1930274 RepID=A0A517MFH9_9BACT|nr:hypothetical protein FF011L_23690 [Roseimaritima multifibrata]